MSQEDVRDRSAFIGGSDIGSLLGLNPYCTPLQLWAEKTGALKPNTEDSEAAILGRELEDYIARRFTRQTGKEVRRVTERKSHPLHDFFRAQIDRLVVGEESIMEAKTVGEFGAKNWKDEEVPASYLAQVMWQMYVTGRKKAYIAYLVGNRHFGIREVDRDPILIAEMAKKALHFWNEFIVPKKMPAIITKDDAPTLYSLFPIADPDSVIELGDEEARLLETRAALYQDCISLENQIDVIENNLRLKMGTKEFATAGNWKCSWKSQTTKRVDMEKFKSEAPELYTRYTKETALRVLRIKAIK